MMNTTMHPHVRRALRIGLVLSCAACVAWFIWCVFLLGWIRASFLALMCILVVKGR